MVQFSDDVRDAYAKNLPTKSQQKAIVDNVCKRRKCTRLEGKEGQRLSATKINFKKPPAGGGARAESNIVPNRHVFIFIFGREIE